MDLAPAADLVALFAFEDQIEPAVVALLTAAGVPACKERDPGDLQTPRVEARLHLGAPTGHRYAPAGAARSPAQTLPDAWHAQLILSTLTNRKSTNPPNAQRHGELLAKSRIAMLQAVGGLNAQLAWLAVNFVSDAGVIPATHAQTDVDVSPAVFSLQFSIKPGAWPVAVPAP